MAEWGELFAGPQNHLPATVTPAEAGVQSSRKEDSLC